MILAHWIDNVAKDIEERKAAAAEAWKAKDQAAKQAASVPTATQPQSTQKCKRMEKAKVSIYVTLTSHTATSSILSSMLLSPYQKVMMRFQMLVLWKVHWMMNTRVTHHRSGCALEKMAPILSLIPFYQISILRIQLISSSFPVPYDSFSPIRHEMWTLQKQTGSYGILV